MWQKVPTQNGVKLPNTKSHRILRLSDLLSRKRITFLGLSALVLLTIFSLAYRISPERAWGSKFALSSDRNSTPSTSRGSQRPRRPTPTLSATPTVSATPNVSATPTMSATVNVSATPTPILTQLPTTTSTQPTSALTSTSTSTTITSFPSTTPLMTLPQPTPTALPSATSSLRTTPLPATPLPTSPKVTRRPSDVSRYVSFSGGFADGRGLGNQIFCFAAVIYVAQLTGREVAIEKFKYVIGLDNVFDLNVERFDSLCPCAWVEEPKHLAFDEETDKKVLNSQETANKSILVGGFRQSWRYTQAIERRLRKHLVFKEEIRKFAEDYLHNHIPPGWNRAGFSRVAIHIRRGDILEKRLADYGYTVPNATYFKKAMDYFTKRYRRVQFITFSQDEKWTKDNIHADKDQPKSVHLTHATGHSVGQDLAIMSMCDHMIMSTGTFGWWGGWLAKGTTVYYSDWPRNGSGLAQQFSREDFFPPSWIPMED